MASAEGRQRADDLIWEGNVELLEHEQRALVQPNFDRLSCSSAWLVAIGSATSFEVRGVRQEVACFTSFYLYSLTRGIPHALRARAWPRITRFDDRWRWLVTSVVPRFRRFDADTHLVDASLRHIFDEARDFASSPCVLPYSPRGRVTASCATGAVAVAGAMAPATAQRMNRSPRDRLLPVAPPRPRPAGGSSWHRVWAQRVAVCRAHADVPRRPARPCGPFVR